MGARKVEYTIPINFARREAYLGTVLGIIGGLLMLTLLVVVHEFGHFTVGRACDMKIEGVCGGLWPEAALQSEKRHSVFHQGFAAGRVRAVLRRGFRRGGK